MVRSELQEIRGDAMDRGKCGMAGKHAGVIKRLATFSALPFFGALLPFIALPVVSRVTTVSEWTSVNVGFGIGAIAAAVGLVGWNVLGTPLVALSETEDDRRRLYGQSFYIRLFVVVALSLPAIGMSALMAPRESWGLAAVFAVATALNGLGMSWYGVGVSSPGLIARYDVLPRAVATSIAIGVVLSTGDAVWYGVLLGLSALIGTALFQRALLGRWLPPWPGGKVLVARLRDMKAAWGVESIGNTFANAPVPLTSFLTPSPQSGAFASADRIFRYGTMAVSAAGNALQGWVLEVRGDHRRSRNIAAIAIMAGGGLLGAAFLAVAGPCFTALLFGAEKQGSPMVMSVLAVAFFAVATSTPLIRNILIPARRDRPVLIATLIAAVCGLSLMIALGLVWGANGIAIGFAASEVIMLVACAVLVCRTGLRPALPDGADETSASENNIPTIESNLS